MKTCIIVVLFATCLTAQAQNKPSIREYKKVFRTYGFSDPDPIAKMGSIYPYYRFDGYTNIPTDKQWKVVELENDFIKLMILPEIGGKIWGAWEKTFGLIDLPISIFSFMPDVFGSRVDKLKSARSFNSGIHPCVVRLFKGRGIVPERPGGKIGLVVG